MILLVQPNYYHARQSGAWGLNPPLGLAYVGAVLEKNGVPVEILDANVRDLSPEQVVHYATQKGVDIVGVSLLTPAHNYGLAVARNMPKGILSVAGGPHATALPEELLADGFDIVVRGEGEYTMLELAQGTKLSDIKGISFKSGDEIIHNPDRDWTDPNKIPFPARHLLEKGGTDLPYYSTGTTYRPWAPIMTSRGCPFDCYYCNKTISGRRFAARDAENVVEEIVDLIKVYGIKEIHINDDCFNCNIERAERILDLMIRKSLNLHLRFSNGFHIGSITRRLVQKMKQAGCYYVALGIESGDQTVLDRIPKHITLAEVGSAVKLFREADIMVTGFFMLGLLGDTMESMQRTLSFAKELDLDIAQFTIACPYPGTRMWNMIKKNGKLLFPEWDNYFHTTGKTVYTYPDTASPKEVEYMYRKAHRNYYSRPGYIIKELLKVRSFGQIRVMLRGLRWLLRTQR